MTPEQRSEAEAKVAEIDTLAVELRDQIQQNIQMARKINASNRDLMDQRATLLSQRAELVQALQSAPPEQATE